MHIISNTVELGFRVVVVFFVGGGGLGLEIIDFGSLSCPTQPQGRARKGIGRGPARCSSIFSPVDKLQGHSVRFVKPFVTALELLVLRRYGADLMNSVARLQRFSWSAEFAHVSGLSHCGVGVNMLCD